MFYREIIKELESWSEKTDRKPLILRGARQVGKTSLVNLFSTKFDQYIYLDLELEKDRKLFEDFNDIDELIEAIFFHHNISKSKGNIFCSSMKSRKHLQLSGNLDIFTRKHRTYS